MTSSPTTLERAFALARSGEFANVSDIRLKLKAEGYDLKQMEGPTLQRQLRQLCTLALEKQS